VTEPLSFFARFGLALGVLFDGLFAARAKVLRDEGPAALLPPPEPEKPAKKEKPKKAEPDPARDEALRAEGALLLLQALQREGRLVDFLEEDVATFADAQIGAAARVVHDGCRKALREHVTLAAVRTEDEGAKVEVPDGFDPDAVKLVGAVSGKAPFRGKLLHKGWRAEKIRLPKRVSGAGAPTGMDASRTIAPAEVEL